MTAQIKVKVQRKAIVKLKLLPRFPSSVTGDNGIIVAKDGGNYTISLDDVLDFTGKTITGATLQSINTITVTPPFGSLTQGLNIHQTGPSSGSTAGPFSYNLIEVTDIGNDHSGSGNDAFHLFATNSSAFRVNTVVGPISGGGHGPIRLGGTFALRYDGTGTLDETVALIGSSYSNTSPGALWGTIGNAHAGPTATISALIPVAAEVSAETGAVISRRVGFLALSNGPVRGSLLDAAFAVSSQNLTGTSGFNSVITLANSWFSGPALETTADFFNSDSAATIANWANMSNVTVTGNIMKFPNMEISGAGRATLKGIDVTNTTGTNTFTVGGGTAAITALSGASNVLGFIQIGRTAAEGYFGVVGTTNDFFTGTVVGDTAVKAGGDLWLGADTVAGIKIGTAGALTFPGYGTGLLHSSLAGVITSSAVNLASADVTGNLPASKVSGTTTNDNAATGIVGEYQTTAVTAANNANSTVTISNASPCLVTWTAHGFSAGGTTVLQFTTTGALPTGLSVLTDYYLTVVDANTLKLSTSADNALAGTFVNTSSAGSGTHTADIRVPMTSGARKNICAMSLSAGDWDVGGAMLIAASSASTVVGYMGGNLATTSAGLDRTVGRRLTFQYGGLVVGNAEFTVFNFGPVRFSLASTTTIYLVGDNSFTVAGLISAAWMRARRVR